jgi:hypothetical protein
MLYAPLTSPMHATCHAHLILLALITLTILGEEYKPCSSSLCSFLQPPVTSSDVVVVFEIKARKLVEEYLTTWTVAKQMLSHEPPFFIL